MSETVADEILIAAPPSDVMAVLRDFERYPVWARSMKTARIVDADEQGRARKVEFHVAPGLLPEMRYVLSYSYDDDTLTWGYVEGDLKDIRGWYKLTDMGGSTHVSYQLSIDPGKDVNLPGFVKARAAREIARIALKELKRQVETG